MAAVAWQWCLVCGFVFFASRALWVLRGAPRLRENRAERQGALPKPNARPEHSDPPASTNPPAREEHVGRGVERRGARKVLDQAPDARRTGGYVIDRRQGQRLAALVEVLDDGDALIGWFGFELFEFGFGLLVVGFWIPSFWVCGCVLRGFAAIAFQLSAAAGCVF